MNRKEEEKPKKILFVSPNLKAAGAQRHTVNIANGLHERGYEVSVFVFENTGFLADCLNEDVKTLFPSPAPLGKFRIPRVIWGIAGLFEAVLRQRPDIIYSRHWPKIPAAAIGKILGAKTVCGEGNALEALRKKNLFRLTRLCARLSDKVVANSKGLAAEAKEGFGLSSEVEVIYNGIDIEDIRKKSLEEKTHRWLGTDVPVIIAMGELKPRKGFSCLLKSLEIISRGRNVRLLIVGGGDRKELSDLAEKLSVEDRTDFLGAVSNPFPYISKADVFVCSSRHEGLSNAILEAMALGKPVISTDHRHGAAEIIQNGVNGVLVPVEDPESMAAAVLRVLGDGKLRASLGEEARKRSEDFSIRRMISEYEKLFSRM